MNAQQQLTPPAIGQIWQGQGGIYAGIMPARNGQEAYHLVLGAELGRFEWGPYGEESSAVSLIDGLANTKNLIGEGDEYPAAKAAAAHSADGHNDFYLPAAAELYEIWLNLGYKDWGWLWSSSQRSADTAFHMYFAAGIQLYDVKHIELRVRPVRPVRRLPTDSPMRKSRTSVSRSDHKPRPATNSTKGRCWCACRAMQQPLNASFSDPEIA